MLNIFACACWPAVIFFLLSKSTHPFLASCGTQPFTVAVTFPWGAALAGRSCLGSGTQNGMLCTDEADLSGATHCLPLIWYSVAVTAVMLVYLGHIHSLSLLVHLLTHCV